MVWRKWNGKDVLERGFAVLIYRLFEHRMDRDMARGQSFLFDFQLTSPVNQSFLRSCLHCLAIRTILDQRGFAERLSSCPPLGLLVISRFRFGLIIGHVYSDSSESVVRYHRSPGPKSVYCARNAASAGGIQYCSSTRCIFRRPRNIPLNEAGGPKRQE